MTNQIPKRKWFLIFASTLIAALLVSAAGSSPKPQEPQQTQKPKKREWPKEPPVTSMPQVFSKIKSIEVIRTWIVNQELGSPDARVEIRNNSGKDIVAIDLVCGNGAVTTNGLTDEENPIIVVKAHETTVLEMNFTAMTFGAPLVVSAVTYADGTEEGDEKSLRAMHLMRKHDRARLKAEREQGRQKGVTKP